MKTLLPFIIRKTNLVAVAGITVVAFLLASSFKQNAACTGPFATTNALGASFAVLGPGGAGAPNEPGTCGRSGCHNVTDNVGPATVFSLGIAGPGASFGQYVPGQTYTVNVAIAQTGIVAFDFELTNRPASGGVNATGSFSLTDPQRTRKSNGSFGAAGNNYVEGTYCGVDVISAGFNQWDFLWTAPASAVGNITFYVGAVAANFNNQATGDNTYSLTKILTPGTLGINEAENTGAFNLYPNPVSENFNMDYSLKKESDVVIKVMDLKGAVIDELLNEKQSPGEHHQNFDLNAKKYAPGFYFVQLSVDDKITNRKLFVQ